MECDKLSDLKEFTVQLERAAETNTLENSMANE